METSRKALQMMQMENSKTFEQRLFKYVVIGFAFLIMVFATLRGKAQQLEKTIFNNVNAEGVILDGYDAVAFFTDNKPVKGTTQFQFAYDKAIYQFASQDHLELFKSDPEKYKPQFGAWCAYAVSLGRVAPIDVNTFSIVNGR